MYYNTLLVNIYRKETMEDPCKICVVNGCCSKRCKDYAIYVYETRQYVNAGIGVAKQVRNMPYDEAIEHILKVESVYLYMKLIDKSRAPVAQ